MENMVSQSHVIGRQIFCGPFYGRQFSGLPFSRSAIARTFVCVCLWLSMAQVAPSQTYEIDIDHTSLVFAVSHSGLSYTYGRFNQCSGQVIVDEDSDDQSFEFTIDSDSIDTNNGLRDDHLRGPDFFDTQAFPEITFKSKTMTKVDNVYTVTGTLKMHGVAKEIEIKLTEIGRGIGPRGKPRIGFFSKFSIKRSDFGIKSLSTIVGNQIAITLSFEGIQTAEPRKKNAPEEKATGDAKSSDKPEPSESANPFQSRPSDSKSSDSNASDSDTYSDANVDSDQQFHILEN